MFPDPGSRSAALFERARRVQPGGNTRHMITFAPYLVYGQRGEGCRLTDADGNVFIDWVNNFSTQIHGYGYAPVLEAAHAQIDRMICCILPSEPEVELAELLCERLPGVEQVRFTNSGAEAAMVAVMAAGLAAMRGLTPEAFDQLERQGERLRAGLTAIFRRLGLSMRANGLGSMTSLQLFTDPATDYREFVTRSGADYPARMLRIHREMLRAGLLIATRGMMIGSTAMSDGDIDETLERAETAFTRLAEQVAAH